MRAVQIGDWDLEDRLWMDRRPTVVQFIDLQSNYEPTDRIEFKALADAYAEAPFYEIDLSENPSAARRFALSGGRRKREPVTVVFVQGVERARHVGFPATGTVKGILGPVPTEGDEPSCEGDEP